MKKLSLLLSLCIISFGLFSQNPEQKESNQSKIDNQVKVYYFHYSRRCATCMAIEDVSRKAVEENYGDKVVFDEFDMDEEFGEAIAKKWSISGQTLIIIKGEKTVDLTNQAFMYARAKPDKLKEMIKEKVDELNKA